jgi:hypothetical protein
MSTLIYQDKSFRIVRVGSRRKPGFIVINTKKGFEKGHSHINNYNMCKHIIWCVKNDYIDEKLNTYLLKSLVRVSNNKEYQTKVTQLIESKNVSSKV